LRKGFIPERDRVRELPAQGQDAAFQLRKRRAASWWNLAAQLGTSRIETPAALMAVVTPHPAGTSLLQLLGGAGLQACIKSLRRWGFSPRGKVSDSYQGTAFSRAVKTSLRVAFRRCDFNHRTYSTLTAITPRKTLSLSIMRKSDTPQHCKGNQQEKSK